ncbi:hypothetical protein GCM10010372_26830 [Streptomyces tauricus]|nr:hypothetical protein GCM10010372_26830 [Streptomyces tauricus]
MLPEPVEQLLVYPQAEHCGPHAYEGRGRGVSCVTFRARLTRMGEVRAGVGVSGRTHGHSPDVAVVFRKGNELF